jgi:putative sterol carrier protein
MPALPPRQRFPRAVGASGRPRSLFGIGVAHGLWPGRYDSHAEFGPPGADEGAAIRRDTASPQLWRLPRRKLLTLEEITEGIRGRVGTQSPIPAIVKFDFEDDGVVRVDGKATPTVVDNEDRDADCTVKVTMDDFAQIAQGKINPRVAFMTGKLRVEGDVSLAMQLGALLR